MPSDFRPGPAEMIPNQVGLLDTSTNKIILVDVIDKCKDQTKSVTFAATTTGATTFKTTVEISQEDLSKCEARVVVAPELVIATGNGALGVLPADYLTIMNTWTLSAKRRGERCEDLKKTRVADILVQLAAFAGVASGRLLPGLNNELAAYFIKCWPAIAYTQDDVIEVTLEGDATIETLAGTLKLNSFVTSSDPAGYPCSFTVMRTDGERAWPVKFVQELIQRYPAPYQVADLAGASPAMYPTQGVQGGLRPSEGIA